MENFQKIANNLETKHTIKNVIVYFLIRLLSSIEFHKLYKNENFKFPELCLLFKKSQIIDLSKFSSIRIHPQRQYFSVFSKTCVYLLKLLLALCTSCNHEFTQ